jgi:hypothetical protein
MLIQGRAEFKKNVPDLFAVVSQIQSSSTQKINNNSSLISFACKCGLSAGFLTGSKGVIFSVRNKKSNPGGGEIYCTSPDLPWGSPSLIYKGYRVFTGGKAAGA